MKNRLIFLFCLVLLSGFATAQEKARRWRVAVIVPEQHLRRAIPDPAVEMELRKQLIDAGYRVIDQRRMRELRSEAVEDRLMRGGTNARAEAIRLARRLNADFLVRGEAFSQLVAQQAIETELGNVNRFRCRARLELELIRVDTAVVDWADHTQITGPGDLSEELASKAAFTSAAEELAPSLLKKLETVRVDGDYIVSLEVRGLTLTSGAKLRNALLRFPGVKDVEVGEVDGGTWYAEVTMTKQALASLPVQLESSKSFRAFRLKVQSSTKSRIIANVK